MATILNIIAREILDSRGKPTIEVDVVSELGSFRAAVPSGASTGKYEALELRDHEKNRYQGFGVLKAVDNVRKIIAPKLLGMTLSEQVKIDNIMIQQLDGTQNEYGYCKSKLGANAILSVSMGICRGAARFARLQLYDYIGKLALKNEFNTTLPIPCFNVLNGGSHAGNKLPFQEFMIVPVGVPMYSDALRQGSEVYHALKAVIKGKYGIDACNVGDEGGFAPSISSVTEALDLITDAIKKCGYEKTMKIALDVAASEFYNDTTKMYNLNFKGSNPDNKTTEEMIEIYLQLVLKYPIVSIEDPLNEDDFENHAKLLNVMRPKNIRIIGDDLLVTNPLRIKRAIETNACDGLLLKINQIGSITEAIEAYNLATANGMMVMVSHRSGETEDSFIADLVVGLGAERIKSGAPCRSERTAKYNQLLRIQEELQNRAKYFGTN